MPTINKERAICLLSATFLAWSVVKYMLYDPGLNSPSTPMASGKNPSELGAAAKASTLKLPPFGEYWAMGQRNPFEPYGGYKQPEVAKPDGVPSIPGPAPPAPGEGPKVAVNLPPKPGPPKPALPPKPAPPPKPPAPKPAAPPPKPGAAIAKPAGKGDSFEIPFQLRGIVRVSDDSSRFVAVVEDKQSRRYLRKYEGDQVLGFRIVQISPGGVIVEDERGRRGRLQDAMRKKYNQ